MATITWTAATSGDWNVASNWSPTQVPGKDDDAIISAPGTYLITVGSAEVNSVTLNDPFAQLSVIG